MNVVAPGRTAVWQRLESVLRAVAEIHGFEEIRLPLVERTELFARSIGEQTDIVEKEMYTFRDVNGDSLSLRPEATASCVRAGIEGGLFHNRECRLWYLGPMFRHERPQKGRYRQFHQFGVEYFGAGGSLADAEVICLGARIFRELGLGDDALMLEINSLGTPAVRARYREDLVAYLRQHESVLDDDSRRRLGSNPLRVLDSKNDAMASIIAAAPQLPDYLGDAERASFDRLRGLLDARGIAHRVNPRLVRGLDYYNGVVFEWVTDRLGAQNAVCAGGRYDGLVEQIGGQATPAAGFALGIERVVELLLQVDFELASRSPDVFVVALGDEAADQGFALVEMLRDARLRVQFAPEGGSMKSQMRRADRAQARYAVIVGEDELREGSVTLKPLRGQGEQRRVATAELIEQLCAGGGDDAAPVRATG
jgi:histidyl-tRNA synthetase